MRYAIRCLRSELNKERAYENQYLQKLDKIGDIRRKEALKRLKQDRINSLLRALSALRQLTKKKLYTWQKPMKL